MSRETPPFSLTLTSQATATVFAPNNVSRSTAYRHKKRIEELGQWQPLSGSHAAASLAQKLSGRRT